MVDDERAVLAVVGHEGGVLEESGRGLGHLDLLGGQGVLGGRLGPGALDIRRDALDKSLEKIGVENDIFGITGVRSFRRPEGSKSRFWRTERTAQHYFIASRQIKSFSYNE